MMIPFSNNSWSEFKKVPDVGFNELSLLMRDTHGETFILAQYLVLLGMKEYARKYDVPLEKISDVMYSRADSVKGFTASMTIESDPIVSPCGSCGGGEVR